MDTQGETRVGFIGLGKMGWPMATCMLKAGLSLVPYDIAPGLHARFVDTVGGECVRSLAELGAACDVVVTVLPNSAIVEQVLFGDDGVAAHLRRGALVIDMTSGVPDATIRFAGRLAEQGVRLFDAPVSGGVPLAKKGALTVMAGGDPAAIDEAAPILAAVGTVVRAGSVGSGHAMKALNNLVSAGGFLIGVEALLVGTKFGIDPETMIDILNISSGMNNSTQKKFKQYVLSRRFDSGFALALMVKDLDTALGLARQQGVDVPFASRCNELWRDALATLEPGADHTAVALASERLGGVEIVQK